MFLNLTMLKKLLTDSFKRTGLYVGRLNHELVVSDSAMGFSIEEEYIPNKLKGTLIELIGDLPEEGEVYLYEKDRQQAEMDFGRFNFYSQWKMAKEFAIETPIVVKGWTEDCSLMQLNSTGKLISVKRIYADIISMKELSASENMPGNPSYSNGFLYWKNGAMIYFAGAYELNEDIRNKLLPTLEQLRFTGKEIEFCDNRNCFAKPENDSLPYV